MWSYRYGRVNCMTIQERRLIMCEATVTSQGQVILTADGQFVFMSEVEDAWFCRAQPPMSPPFNIQQDKLDCELALAWEEAHKERMMRASGMVH